ncbi:MAG: hypothetical protein NT075_14320 [Chloroflexi bacterium]|nr:hypothetical protein [Chloroflexota bacterium]
MFKHPLSLRLQTLFSLLVILTLTLEFSLPALPVQAQAPVAATLIDEAGGAYEQIEVVLRADQAPAAGGVATFTFTAKPLRNAPDLAVIWELPDGATLLGGGASETLGVVAAGQTVQQTRQVQFPQAGIYTVSAKAVYHPDAATSLTAMGILFFTINDGQSTASDLDPRTPRYTPPTVKPTIDKSGKAVAAGAASPNAPQGCFNVTGFLTRGERQPTPSGYLDVGGSAVPVHNILVEMREEDTISDDSYGHTVTDANGHFEFHFCDDDGFLNDELELYIRVCAEVWDGPNKIARIDDYDDDELYCFDSGTIDSEGGTVDFDVTAYAINSAEAQIFNIADSIYWAWKYWNNSGGPAVANTLLVYWNGSRGQKGSFYSDTRTTMVVGDDPSNPSQWDDSVVMHEYGHFLDHQFSCNQNPGGAHTLPGFNNGSTGQQLSWGEGFPDYYQSAVRTLQPGAGFTSTYIDINGPIVDFESAGGTASDRNEGAIAGLLWDFFDTANDNQDTVSHGEALIQQVYTSSNFRTNTQCDMRSFLKAWKDLGKPTDAATAAAVVQNVGINKPFGVAAAQVGPVQAAATQSAADPLDYRWWDQVTMVLDNSASMAQSGKLDAVKSLIHEQVTDLAAAPHGTEFNLYTFNANTPSHSVVAGNFFANQFLPTVDGVVANGADAGCPVRALDAMSQAIRDKAKGDVWVYTDGDTPESSASGVLRQRLTQQKLHVSFVVLGGCNTLPTKQSDVSGGEKNYLGLAADGSQPSGIVPYLLTALGSGGQFLFVAPNQLSDAVDVLRAQSHHSAGAGKWSDYVSNANTYRWDRLTSWEYKWIDTSLAAGGAFVGQPNNQGIIINFPQSFPFFFRTDNGFLYDSGFMVMGSKFDLGSPSLSIFSANLTWKYRYCGPNVAASAAAVASPDSVPCDTRYVEAFTKQEGDWFAVTTTGIAEASDHERTYQVLFNAKTGELRYQYKAVESADVGNARIGLNDSSYDLYDGSVTVADKTVNGASNGMGYKFVSAPPQPAKTYTVTADALISGIGFLQTGYSGSFAPMTVQRPDKSFVNCKDEGVICTSLNNNLVQYIQVNTNGQTDVYTATISVGNTGQGTFSFNALATSEISVQGLGKRALALQKQNLLVDLGRPADGNVLQGWLQNIQGARFGNAFQLYDDGAHNDGAISDGVFGSDDFTPPAAGVAYLWAQGQVGGVGITRSDPTPYNFQLLDVQPNQAELEGYYDEAVTVQFNVTNQDTVRHCYTPQFDVPDGWFANTLYTPNFCVQPGATGGPTVDVGRAADANTKGEVGEVGATFTEVEAGSITGGDSVRVSLFRKPASVVFDNRWEYTYLRPNNSDTVSMTVKLLDDTGEIVGRSLDVTYDLKTTLGTVTATGHFENGRMPVQFTAGNETGDATITFTLAGGATATTTLHIRNATASVIDLTASPNDLSNGVNNSTLVATLHDSGGNPVVDQLVRISVSDDTGARGTVNNGEVFTGTTDAQGQVAATFVKAANAQDQVAVRAEALVADGAGGYRVTQEDTEILKLAGQPTISGPNLYLPMIRNGIGQSAAANLVIYSDGVTTGWTDWSWDSTVQFEQATQVHSGSKAIAVTYNAAWGAFSLNNATQIDTSGYRAIQFWIYGNGKTINVHTQAIDEGPESIQVPFTPPAGQWTQITVSISALGNPSIIKRINVQEFTGAPQAAIYLDDVMLIR